MKHECEWYIQVMGTNPNTGQEVNKFGCAMSFIPMLLIENSQQQRQTGAAVESFRNEMMKQNNQLMGGLSKELEKKNGQHPSR